MNSLRGAFEAIRIERSADDKLQFCGELTLHYRIAQVLSVRKERDCRAVIVDAAEVVELDVNLQKKNTQKTSKHLVFCGEGGIARDIRHHGMLQKRHRECSRKPVAPWTDLQRSDMRIAYRQPSGTGKHKEAF